MTDIQLPDDYLDMEDVHHTVRRSRQLRRQRLYGPFTLDECKLNCIVGLCGFFTIILFATLASVCMHVACVDNPCNPYCPKHFRVDNGTDQCSRLSRPERSLSRHQGPPKGNSWYDQMNASASDAERTNCIVCSAARPELIIVGFPTTGKPQSRNANDNMNTFSYSALRPEELKLSPLDCLLLHEHVPRRFEKETFRKFWTFDKNATKHGCRPLKPKDRPALQLPTTKPKLHHNITMVCLKCLIINGSHEDNLNYTDFSNDPGAKCSETWLVIPKNDSVNWLRDTQLHGPEYPPKNDTDFERFHSCDNDSAWGAVTKAHTIVRLTSPSASGLLWLCNATLYRALPSNWTGVCGLVTLAQEIHIQTTNTQQTRKKRSTDSGDLDKTYIDAIGVPRGIPREFKAQNEIAAGFISS